MIYWLLFSTYFLIGLFSFGGGMGMMAMIEQEVVNNRHWLTAQELYQFIGISESTPGPIAVNLATFIGESQGGFFGAVCATLGCVLPSFIVILLVAILFQKIASNSYVQASLTGLRAVVLGLLFAMAVKIITLNILGTFTYNTSINFSVRSLLTTIILIVIYFGYGMLTKKKLPPIAFILMSVVIGILISL